MSAWIAGAVVATGAIGAGVSAFGASQGADAAEGATKGLSRRLNQAANEVEGYAQDYASFLDKLDADFDPFDVEDAFNSLYEAVIQPMERDFDENVLPGIQAAYSGGIMGGGVGLSGAGAEAESNARRGQAENKAQLRFQERNQAIDQNYREYDRRAKLGASKLSAQTMGPSLRAGQASEIYGAETNSIGARTAAWNQLGSGITNTATTGLSAYQNRVAQDNTDTLIKKLT